MRMCNRGDRKLLAVEGVGHRARCPHVTRPGKENTKHLKCINFSASDRTACCFSGWAQKSGALRSFSAISQNSLLNSLCAFTVPVHCAPLWLPFWKTHWNAWWSECLFSCYLLFTFLFSLFVFVCVRVVPCSGVPFIKEQNQGGCLFLYSVRHSSPQFTTILIVLTSCHDFFFNISSWSAKVDQAVG